MAEFLTVCSGAVLPVPVNTRKVETKSIIWGKSMQVLRPASGGVSAMGTNMVSSMARLMVMAFVALVAVSAPAQAQVTAFKQAVAEAASNDADIATFYRDRNYEPIWTGRGGEDRKRRQAFLNAVTNAANHGLPVARYNPEQLKAVLSDANTPRARGAVEVEMSRIFLRYAKDLQTGVLDPGKIDEGLVKQVPYRDRLSYLTSFTRSNPKRFLQAIAPQTREYTALMKAKLLLERQLGRGGFGPEVPARALKPGESGPAVVALRNRLIAMGYMKRSLSRQYDSTLQAAVQQFQAAHGLTPDGVVGAGTMSQINEPLERRMQSVMVAMERERWLNRPLGDRHIWVNLTDFTAKVVDHGQVSFVTRSVIGKNQHDRRSPEFSDVMEHMIVNPTWHVPRSIATKEYLPRLQNDPNAVSYLKLVDVNGRTVDRSAVDFTQFTERNFPFDIKQPPSRGNALGLVKFMFPNRYNIYLHDTPEKHLFGRESRAYSHGCIRLHQPFDFAYALLAKQEADPVGFFQSVLKSGQETQVDLVQPVPVHIVYRTAFTTADSRLHFRRDIYGRDARIFDALVNAGVVMRAVRS